MISFYTPLRGSLLTRARSAPKESIYIDGCNLSLRWVHRYTKGKTKKRLLAMAELRKTQIAPRAEVES